MLIYPKIATVHQAFDRTKIDDVAKAVRDELTTLDLGAQVRSGQSVALTAGSRGIDNIEMILRTVVDFLKDLGAEPFIVPAMGSHGGGTVPGQTVIRLRT